MSGKEIDAPKILIFGEVLLDLFVTKSLNSEGFAIFDCKGLPGGAPCNVAANLAKCGSNVELITAFGDDLIGKELYRMLNYRGVGLQKCFFPKLSSTPLATVSNEPNGQNDFRIYLEGSAFSNLNIKAFKQISFEETDWMHLGSVLLSQKNTKEITFLLAQRASESGCVVSYDINVRPNILSQNMEKNDVLIELLRYVDILKLSDEDFDWIKANILPEISEPKDLLSYGCSIIAWTHGAAGSTIITEKESVKVAPSTIIAKDTTGAGDAFTAGFIHHLVSNGLHTKKDIQKVIDDEVLLSNAGMFATSLATEIIAHQGALPKLT